MDDKVNGKIILSILKFLRKEVESNTLSSDACESVEVAIQCLESAYGADANMEEGRIIPDLVELFCVSDVWTIPSNESLDEASPEAKAEAEEFKNQGNNLMKEEKFDDAIKKYSSAIGLDANNAVYYCNRAAAHSKLGNHQAAIDDCSRALELDPTYSKAYGRLGIAYSSLNQHENARSSYLKALELEPDNESYKNNLNLTIEQITQQRVRNASGGTSGMAGPTPFELSAILNNPALMSMATNMLSNPNVQNMMSSLMQGTGDVGIETLMQAGQQLLAQQMQNVNPDFVESLRRQMSGQDGGQEPAQDAAPDAPSAPQPKKPDDSGNPPQ